MAAHALSANGLGMVDRILRCAATTPISLITSRPANIKVLGDIDGLWHSHTLANILQFNKPIYIRNNIWQHLRYFFFNLTGAMLQPQVHRVLSHTLLFPQYPLKYIYIYNYI